MVQVAIVRRLDENVLHLFAGFAFESRARAGYAVANFRGFLVTERLLRAEGKGIFKAERWLARYRYEQKSHFRKQCGSHDVCDGQLFSWNL